MCDFSAMRHTFSQCIYKVYIIGRWKRGLQIPRDRAHFRELCDAICDSGIIPTTNIVKYIYIFFAYGDILNLAH